MQIKAMKNALNKIASSACLNGGKEDCTCVTCFAGSVLDKLYPEPKVEPEEETEISTIKPFAVSNSYHPSYLSHLVEFERRGGEVQASHHNASGEAVHAVGDGCFPDQEVYTRGPNSRHPSMQFVGMPAIELEVHK